MTKRIDVNQPILLKSALAHAGFGLVKRANRPAIRLFRNFAELW